MRDLDGDGEPEAIVGGFTGGAHCCVLALVYRWTGSGHATFENNFRDPGYRLVDLDRDGRYEFRTADARFAFLYGSFAESVFPIQILRFEGTGFGDVTDEFRDAVAKDTRRVRREYRRRAASSNQLGVRSALAAYVADLYQLDRGLAANRTLRSALRRGLLEPGRFTVGPDGRRFVRNLSGTRAAGATSANRSGLARSNAAARPAAASPAQRPRGRPGPRSARPPWRAPRRSRGARPAPPG